jgi:hypothetical protein
MLQHSTKPQGGTFYILCALDDIIAEHETSYQNPVSVVQQHFRFESCD